MVGQRHQRKDEMRIAFAVPHRAQAAAAVDQNEWRSAMAIWRTISASRQTLFTAARPSRPFGMTASARMTTENTTIWV